MFRELGGMWEEIRPKVWDFMENSEQMNVIRVSKLRPPPHVFFIIDVFLTHLLYFRQNVLIPFHFFLSSVLPIFHSDSAKEQHHRQSLPRSAC